MPSFFLFNNIYFAIEIFGSFVFLMVAWLSVDAYLSRRDFLTASRGIGFGFLALGQLMNSLIGNGDFFDYTGHIFFLIGLFFVFWNLFLETPISKSELRALIMLPPVASFAYFCNVVSLFFLAGIAFLAFKQYILETKRSLIPFALSFVALTIGFGFSLFYEKNTVSGLWAVELLFEFLGYSLLSYWLWDYMRTRNTGEMLSIFVFAILIVSVAITFIFSILLSGQIEERAKESLISNSKTLELNLGHLKEESLAKAKFLADSDKLKKFMAENPRNESAILEVASKFATEEKLSFVIITDSNGKVLARSNSIVRRGDTIRDEKIMARALFGESVTGVGYGTVEKFSVRSATPISNGARPAGVVLAGFYLNDFYADAIKAETGLDVAIYRKDTLVASTLVTETGVRRSFGAKITDQNVLEPVLIRGEAVALRTNFYESGCIGSFLPIKDIDGEPIGAMAVIKLQKDIVEIVNTRNILTLTAVVIIALILITPAFIISKR